MSNQYQYQHPQPQHSSYQQPQYWAPPPPAHAPSEPPSRQLSGIWWSRLSFRVLGIIFDVAIIGLSAFYYSQWTLGPLAIIAPPAIAAFMWCCADTIMLFARGDRAGAHPAACLIIDLLLFLALAALSGVIAFTVSRFDDSGYYFALFINGAGEEYLRMIIAFGVLSTLCHLAVLLIAGFQLKKKKLVLYQPAPQFMYIPTPAMQHMPAMQQTGPPPPSYEENQIQSGHQMHEMQAREQFHISEMQGASYAEMPAKKAT